MRRLYPYSEPFVQHSLAMGDDHVLHVSEYGRPDGIPVLFLHGGPGAATAAWHPRLFDHTLYRVVTVDQRGCGRSTPHASVEANTTDHLLADLERVREHLELDAWLVAGLGWGTTLGLLYGQTHRERVHGLVLQGVFLGRPRDIDWFYRDGAHRLLPEAWRDFLAPIPADERDDPLAGYHRRLFGNDDIARMAAAKAWSTWQGRASTLMPDRAVVSHYADPSVALSLARIQCHYFINGGYLEANRILDGVDRLEGLPGALIHGRYDLVCPVEQADALAGVWRDAELEVVVDAGHAGTEPGIVDAVVRATDRFASLLHA